MASRILSEVMDSCPIDVGPSDVDGSNEITWGNVLYTRCHRDSRFPSAVVRFYWLRTSTLLANQILLCFLNGGNFETV